MLFLFHGTTKAIEESLEIFFPLHILTWWHNSFEVAPNISEIIWLWSFTSVKWRKSFQFGYFFLLCFLLSLPLFCGRSPSVALSVFIFPHLQFRFAGGSFSNRKSRALLASKGDSLQQGQPPTWIFSPLLFLLMSFNHIYKTPESSACDDLRAPLAHTCCHLSLVFCQISSLSIRFSSLLLTSSLTSPYLQSLIALCRYFFDASISAACPLQGHARSKSQLCSLSPVINRLLMWHCRALALNT